MRTALLYAAAFLALVVVVILAGFWLGGLGISRPPAAAPGIAASEPSSADASSGPHEAAPAVTAPLYLSLGPCLRADPNAAADEIRMASAAGIHQYVISTRLTWEPGDAPLDELRDALSLLASSDAQAEAMLRVTLDPSPAWLDAHPEAAAVLEGQMPARVSIASEAWLAAALDGLDELAGRKTRVPIRGYIVSCLEQGAWILADGYDRSEANTAAFRAWLSERYDDEALQAAWADEAITLASASVPDKPASSGTESVFFELPAERPFADYLEFLSDFTASTIAWIAEHVKDKAGPDVLVLAPYGYSFEVPGNDAGHFALRTLMDSGVDGFVSPMSYTNRGVGGTGGFMGPVDSARLHGKRWLVIDDTRTGIAMGHDDEAAAHAARVPVENVYGVQARTFAAALTHELGLVWADLEPCGQLCDEDMWRRFERMRDVYTIHCAAAGASEAQPTRLLREPKGEAALAVVVDEAARFFQRCDRDVNAALLRAVADCALQAGCPVHFYLLDDVLNAPAPLAAVYLFVNAFHLSRDERDLLHARLAENGAAALWLYAPGYFDETAAEENISATTGMTVKAFDGPAVAGSICQLPQRWVRENEPLGSQRTWSPLFYIEDEEASVVAKYGDSERVSAAIAFLEAGWTSVYIAEPALSPSLLREILQIFEKHVYVGMTPARLYDTIHLGSDLIAIHAQGAGERLIELTQTADVTDLLDPAAGWPRKRTFKLPLEPGQTRLLKLKAVE